MTRKELSSLYWLNKEIAMWERKLEEMRANTGLSAINMDGMPHSHSVSSAVESAALAEADTLLLIADMKSLAVHKRNELYHFIQTIEDPLLAMVVQYRCIDCQTWEDVAMSIGPNTSGEACRKMFERAFPK